MTDEKRQAAAQPQGSSPPPDDIPIVTFEQAKAMLGEGE
jgi:hypothetical protein